MDDKQINKRFKEILNFFHIEETPSYEFDFPFVDYTQVRCEETVRDCHNLLTNHTKNAWESLLWFQLVDSYDEEMFQCILDGNYDKSANGWKKKFSDTKKYHYLKNYVILELLSYENQKLFA